MAKTIWKFPVPADRRFTLTMPSGSVPLSVQAQNGEPFMWALIDPKSPPCGYNFALVATGQPDIDEIADWGDFIGTFQVERGTLVFHLFAMPFRIPTGGDLNDD